MCFLEQQHMMCTYIACVLFVNFPTLKVEYMLKWGVSVNLITLFRAKSMPWVWALARYPTSLRILRRELVDSRNYIELSQVGM